MLKLVETCTKRLFEKKVFLQEPNIFVKINQILPAVVTT